MNIEELFSHRQSCRNYSDKPIDKQILEKVIRLASLAPSACNSQPWRVICVSGEKAKDFAKCVQSLGQNKFASKAQAFYVIIETKAKLLERVAQSFKDSAFTENDIGIFVAHIVLALESFGIGSCILGWRSVDKIQEFLSLPKDTKIPLVISMGYPAEDDVVREKKRKDFTEIYSYFE